MGQVSDLQPISNRLLVALPLAALLAGCTKPPNDPAPQSLNPAQPAVSPYGEEFRSQWPEGKAQIFTYALTGTYGRKKRSGTATAIFAPSPATTALTFRLSREYDEGPGSVHEMESVLMITEPLHGLPEGGITKVTASAQSWTGHWWWQWLIAKGSITVDRYGDVRPGRKIIEFPGLFVPEQALPLCARRIAWPRLRLGQNRPTYVLRDSIPMEPEPITLKLSSDRHTAATPAGNFRTHLFTAAWPDGATRKWFVGIDPPHNIVRWEFSNGERAELLKSETVKMPAH